MTSPWTELYSDYHNGKYGNFKIKVFRLKEPLEIPDIGSIRSHDPLPYLELGDLVETITLAI